MNMVEKMARAMAANDSGPEGSALFAIHWHEFGDGYMRGALTALRAMEEPTEGMLRSLQSWAKCSGYVEEGWKAAIRSAITEAESK